VFESDKRKVDLVEPRTGKRVMNGAARLFTDVSASLGESIA